MNNTTAYLAYARKAIIQILTLVVTMGTAVATFSQLPDKYAAIVTGAVAAAGSLLHFLVPNAPAPGTVPAEEAEEINEDGDLPEFSDEELITTVHGSTPAPLAAGRHEASE